MARKNTGSIQVHGNRFRISYFVDGIRQRESFATREDAERELAIRLADIKKGIPVSSRPNTVLFGELAIDVVNDYKINNRRSIDDLEARFRCHIVPALGLRKASTITTAQLNAYIVRRREETVRGSHPSVGTINRELEAIRHTFRLAVHGGKLHHMPHVPHLREQNVRTGFLTGEQVDRLVSHLPDPIARFVRFAFLTGWRKGEIQDLKWSHVDFAGGELRLDPGSTKSGYGRVFPMIGELRTLLGEAKDAQDLERSTAKERGVVPKITPYVFTVDGRRVGEFRKTWKAACHRAGLPCTLDKTGRVLASQHLFHDLRRSAVKVWIKSGMPVKVAMMLSGHKTQSMIDRYDIVGEADLIEASRYLEPAEPISPKFSPKTGF